MLIQTDVILLINAPFRQDIIFLSWHTFRSNSTALPFKSNAKDQGRVFSFVSQIIFISLEFCFRVLCVDQKKKKYPELFLIVTDIQLWGIYSSTSSSSLGDAIFVTRYTYTARFRCCLVCHVNQTSAQQQLNWISRKSILDVFQNDTERLLHLFFYIKNIMLLKNELNMFVQTIVRHRYCKCHIPLSDFFN